MGPRRNPNYSTDKRQERENRQQAKKTREKGKYVKNDEHTRTFNEQLRAFNLQLRDIPGDGNCLFRSFADQLDGNQQQHRTYREKICQFMRENREDFEPFIIDQPFDDFLRSMAKDGTYGGNECLVAFSRLYDAKICIHQLGQPVWTVCFSDRPKHEIHISYHNYEHYSSVRRLGDRTSDSANVRQAMTTRDPSSITNKNSASASSASGTTKQKHEYVEELFTEHDIDYIESQLSGPIDRQIIRDTLTDHQGDIDGAIVDLLTLTISTSSPEPPPPIVSDLNDDPLQRIMHITGFDDVELVEQLFLGNGQNIEFTVQQLMNMKSVDKVETINEDETNDGEWTEVKPKNTPRPPAVSNRQSKTDKKKAKKQRAMEKHREKIISQVEKNTSSSSTGATGSNVVNNNVVDPLLGPPANMEFIQI